MNINIKLRITIALFAALAINITTHQLHAQVTVGSDKEPAKAAILEIKDYEESGATAVTDEKNVTAKTGGLGLPRVKLEDKTTLDPFISSTGADWTTAATKEELSIKHAGLMVYNLNVTYNDTSVTDLNKRLKQGVYVWDGSKWTLVGEGVGQRFFYMPSFNIKLDNLGTGFTADLYRQYYEQFSGTGATTLVTNTSSTLTTIPSPTDGQLYTSDELDYVITYYDPVILDNLSIDDAGVLTYDVISLDVTANSFLNIVLVIKE